MLTSAFVIAYKKLEGNINADLDRDDLGDDRPEAVEVEGPKKPLNVLVMGSDNRDGTNIGGDTPGLSDTTILLHLSADRKRAYGVSLPRDAMVERPECKTKNGKKTVPGGLTQFNAAYAVGGPACTIKTVEKPDRHPHRPLRGDRLRRLQGDGERDQRRHRSACPRRSTTTSGTSTCRRAPTRSTAARPWTTCGCATASVPPTGDIGRMKRQQAFIAAMVEKVVSKGTLANPVRLYRFLDAATQSLTTDTGFAHLKELASLGSSLKNIGLDNVQFITVPEPALRPRIPTGSSWRPRPTTCGARSASTSRWASSAPMP